MRTIRFPLGNEDPTILEYLLDTVLLQNGSVLLYNGNTEWEVSVIVRPNIDGYDNEVGYLVRLVRKPKQMRWTRAKYIGVIAETKEDIMSTICDYEMNIEGELVKDKHRKFHNKACAKKVYHCEPIKVEEA